MVYWYRQTLVTTRRRAARSGGSLPRGHQSCQCQPGTETLSWLPMDFRLLYALCRPASVFRATQYRCPATGTDHEVCTETHPDHRGRWPRWPQGIDAAASTPCRGTD